MLIGICDDNIRDAETVSQIVKAVATNRKWNIEIEPFTVVSKESLHKMLELDFLLLDIEMPGFDGIEIKERLQNQDVLIAFISSHEERIYESFGKNVIGFIQKPVKQEELEFYLEKAVALVKFRSGVILIEGKSYYTSEISYIEANHVYSKVHFVTQKELLLRKSIGIWEKELADYGFFRVHRSYLINMALIEQIDNHAIKMQGFEDEIPVSRSAEKAFWNEYEGFCKRRLRY